ncbi:hypothetical protein TIFTF001_011695 [Ficus carica]|uniref:Uncharacterized protein n=1 Tax=Ficus carica TaxID=3494 RepID=A0AA88D5L5_FICCA|nr:hypothetical protein TIFTF001_011695 [Ficus carica]
MSSTVNAAACGGEYHNRCKPVQALEPLVPSQEERYKATDIITVIFLCHCSQKDIISSYTGIPSWVKQTCLRPSSPKIRNALKAQDYGIQKQ